MPVSPVFSHEHIGTGTAETTWSRSHSSVQGDCNIVADFSTANFRLTTRSMPREDQNDLFEAVLGAM